MVLHEVLQKVLHGFGFGLGMGVALHLVRTRGGGGGHPPSPAASMFRAPDWKTDEYRGLRHGVSHYKRKGEYTYAS